MLTSGLQVLGCNTLYLKNTIFLFCCKRQLLTKVKLGDNNVAQIRDPQDQSYWICSIHKKYCIYKNSHKLLSINYTTFTILLFLVDLQNKYIIPAVLLIHWKFWYFMMLENETCCTLHVLCYIHFFSRHISVRIFKQTLSYWILSIRNQ